MSKLIVTAALILSTAAAHAASIHYTSGSHANLKFFSTVNPGNELELNLPADVDATLDMTTGALTIAKWDVLTSDHASIVYSVTPQVIPFSPTRDTDPIMFARIGAGLVLGFNAPIPVIDQPLMPQFPTLRPWSLLILSTSVPEPGAGMLIVLAFAYLCGCGLVTPRSVRSRGTRATA